MEQFIMLIKNIDSYQLAVMLSYLRTEKSLRFD